MTSAYGKLKYMIRMSNLALVVKALDCAIHRVSNYPTKKVLAKPLIIALFDGQRFKKWIALSNISTTGA